jgi:hypothetical protein
MTGGYSTVDVDVLVLERFTTTLDARVAQADALLSQLDELTHRGTPLGDFPDARAELRRQERLCATYRDHLERLRGALVAARQATATIVANYASAEERNTASAAAIASCLDAPVAPGVR